MATKAETKDALASFLSAPMVAGPDVVVVSTEPPSETGIPILPPSEAESTVVAAVISPEYPDAEMEALCAHLKRIGMCAKDMHYRVKGKAFYGEHLLSDLIWDAEHETDNIIEIYFMGERNITPPRMADICRTAANLDVHYESNDKFFESGVKDICYRTMKIVEHIKSAFPNLAAGTHAVLDESSQKCLLALGLISQTLKG